MPGEVEGCELNATQSTSPVTGSSRAGRPRRKCYGNTLGMIVLSDCAEPGEGFPKELVTASLGGIISSYFFLTGHLSPAGRNLPRLIRKRVLEIRTKQWSTQLDSWGSSQNESERCSGSDIRIRSAGCGQQTVALVFGLDTKSY